MSTKVDNKNVCHNNNMRNNSDSLYHISTFGSYTSTATTTKLTTTKPTKMRGTKPSVVRGVVGGVVGIEKKETFYVFDQRMGRKRRHDPWFASLTKRQQQQQQQQLQQQQQQLRSTIVTTNEEDSSQPSTPSTLTPPSPTTLSAASPSSTIIAATTTTTTTHKPTLSPFSTGESFTLLPHAIEVIPQLDFSSPPFPFGDSENPLVPSPTPLSPGSPPSGSDEEIPCEYWNELVVVEDASALMMKNGKENSSGSWSLQEEIDWCLDLLN